MVKPVLLLDVDGVVNLIDAKPDKWHKWGYELFMVAAHNSEGKLSHYPCRLQKDVVKDLLSLSSCYDLVWATTWNDEANKLLDLFRFPHLPVLFMDEPDSVPYGTPLFWKSEQIASAFSPGGEYAGRDFVWLDDQTTKRDRAYLEAVLPDQKVKLVLVNNMQGVTTSMLKDLEDKAKNFFGSC